MGDKYYNLTTKQTNFITSVLEDNELRKIQGSRIVTERELDRLNKILDMMIYIDQDRFLLNELAEYYRNENNK